jgi:uncharacterized protein (TIGR02147 family)
MDKKIYDYLKDAYTFLKSTDKKYSQRYFSLKLGVKSTGFLSEIFNGKRNLSQNNVLQWFKVLKLDKDECNYFQNLVNFNQAKSFIEKDFWLQKMMECKKVNTKILNKDVYEYFSKWYYAAIRELLFFYKSAVDPKEVASMLNPSITVDEAKAAFVLLEKLNLIAKNSDGSYSQNDSIVSTGNQITSTEIANYQLQTIDLAKNAINKISLSKRNISTLTLSISENGFNKIIDILQAAKKDILKVTQSDSGEDRIYQVNIQLFPLTKTKSE